jgi:hypothetical protein
VRDFWCMSNLFTQLIRHLCSLVFGLMPHLFCLIHYVIFLYSNLTFSYIQCGLSFLWRVRLLIHIYAFEQIINLTNPPKNWISTCRLPYLSTWSTCKIKLEISWYYMKLEYILKIIIMFVPFKKKKNITFVGIINIETTDILD